MVFHGHPFTRLCLDCFHTHIFTISEGYGFLNVIPFWGLVLNLISPSLFPKTPPIIKIRVYYPYSFYSSYSHLSSGVPIGAFTWYSVLVPFTPWSCPSARSNYSKLQKPELQPQGSREGVRRQQLYWLKGPGPLKSQNEARLRRLGGALCVPFINDYTVWIHCLPK